MPPTPRFLGLTQGQRETVTLACGLGWGTVELWFFGARPGALTFITGILLSVPAARIDKARRLLRSGDET